MCYMIGGSGSVLPLHPPHPPKKKKKINKKKERKCITLRGFRCVEILA